MPDTLTSVNAYTLAEMGQYYVEKGDLSFATVLEVLNQDNPILEHCQWVRGNLIDGHRGSMRAGIPTPQLRRYYQGVASTKSETLAVRATTVQIADRWSVDKDVLALYEGESDQNIFRVTEGRAHIEGMKQKACNLLLYGNAAANVDEPNGLSALYRYKDSPNVIDAGATSGDTTSIWGIVWGNDAFHGIYPKNIPAGIRTYNLGEMDFPDASGLPYRAFCDEWKWDIGFFQADWRTVVRICNISVANLAITDPTDANFVDIPALCIKAKRKIPAGMRNRLRWYASDEVMLALELQSIKHQALRINLSETTSAPTINTIVGREVYECDAILNTETALTATP